MKHTDTHKHQGLRKKLIEEIRAKGITDERVLKAMGKIPRHFFIDDSIFDGANIAYRDAAFSIGEGQTISQPFTVAYQTELLEIKPGDKILEIGTGSGYQSCVLAEMGARVFTIERFKKLSNKAKEMLDFFGYKNVKTFFGDGFEGLPSFAPFDKIIITAAAPEIPEKLKQQLKVGGYLVVPFGEGELQKMIRLKKISDIDFEEEISDSAFRFVPMLKGKVY